MHIGLDFEARNGKNKTCIPLLVCLNGENVEEAYDLTKTDECTNFLIRILTVPDKYIVFNASYDVEIIMNYLLRLDYRFLRNDEDPQDMTMKLLSGDKIYKLEIFTRYKGELIKSTFIDLGNIIVGESLKNVAKYFTDLEKGNLEEASLNHEDFIKYCMQDARITRVAYDNICKMLGFEVITIGSAAFKTMLNMNWPKLPTKKQKQEFKNIFGFTSIKDDDYLRHWYVGGYGWCSTDDRLELRVNSYDLKSAYPSQSITTLPTYIGHITQPGYHRPTKEYPFAFIHFKMTGEVKPDYSPVLPSANLFTDSNRYIYDDDDVYIIQEYNKKSEYEWFLENVHIDNIEYQETILMKESSCNPLKVYMLTMYKLKSTTTGSMHEFAKRMLNSLTGKLGTNPHKENKMYKLDQTGTLAINCVEDTTIDTYATFAIAVITSRVRCKCYTADSLLRGKVKFRLYATDSVKHQAGINVIPEGHELGDWELEYDNIGFIYLGLKSYIFDPLNETGKRKIVCAGISNKFRQDIKNEDFYSGNRVKSLVSERGTGGRVIYETLKKIPKSIKKARTRREAIEYGDRLEKSKNKKANIARIL